MKYLFNFEPAVSISVRWYDIKHQIKNGLLKNENMPDEKNYQTTNIHNFIGKHNTLLSYLVDSESTKTQVLTQGLRCTSQKQAKKQGKLARKQRRN